MSNLIRCDVCNGRKRVLGMGGIQKECLSCEGIGWIESILPSVITEGLVNLNGEPVKARKKPGPKARVQKDMFANVE